VAVALMVPSGAQASANACLDITAPYRCTALTADDQVSVGVVRTGEFTAATWRVRCTQGSHTFATSGVVRRGARTLFSVPLHGNVTCALQATGTSVRGPAFVRVALR
jgi:hypothetical protein